MTPLEGGLIVSCQADPTDAFYGLMDRFARAALAGGAKGIRANGPDDIRAIRHAVELPIIGIQKSLHHDGKILITPSFESALALASAGATAIALDCTRRGQASGAFDRLRRMKAELKLPVMADIATVEEAIAAFEAGADFVLSTMRGYTVDTSDIAHFDPRFIEQLVRAVGVPVIAEGRVDTPDLARQAIEAGAFAVVVGSTITRPHLARYGRDAGPERTQRAAGSSGTDCACRRGACGGSETACLLHWDCHGGMGGSGNRPRGVCHGESARLDWNPHCGNDKRRHLAARICGERCECTGYWGKALRHSARFKQFCLHYARHRRWRWVLCWRPA